MDPAISSVPDREHDLDVHLAVRAVEAARVVDRVRVQAPAPRRVLDGRSSRTRHARALPESKVMESRPDVPTYAPYTRRSEPAAPRPGTALAAAGGAAAPAAAGRGARRARHPGAEARGEAQGAAAAPPKLKAAHDLGLDARLDPRLRAGLGLAVRGRVRAAPAAARAGPRDP